MSLLANKVAIITGAVSGIGRATAQKFAAEGALVVAADISAAACEATYSAVQELGNDAGWQQVDVSKRRKLKVWLNTW